MAYYKGSTVGFYYNEKYFLFHFDRVPPPAEKKDGRFITSDGLYFITADHQEFTVKESANG